MAKIPAVFKAGSWFILKVQDGCSLVYWFQKTNTPPLFIHAIQEGELASKKYQIAQSYDLIRDGIDFPVGDEY